MGGLITKERSLPDNLWTERSYVPSKGCVEFVWRILKYGKQKLIYIVFRKQRQYYTYL